MSKSKYRRIKQKESGGDSRETRKHPTPSGKMTFQMTSWSVPLTDVLTHPKPLFNIYNPRKTPSHLSMVCLPPSFFSIWEKGKENIFNNIKKHTKEYILKMIISFSWLKSSYLFLGFMATENHNFLCSCGIHIDCSQYSFLLLRFHGMILKL